MGQSYDYVRKTLCLYVFETTAMLKAIILSEIEMALPAGNEGVSPLFMFTMQTVIYSYHVSDFQVAVNERR